MKLIQYMMPPFARIQWRSRSVKDLYGGMFNDAVGVYQSLELLSVIHGIRNVTTMHISPDRFDHEQQELIKHGLVFLPLKKVGLYNGFSNYHPQVIEGQPWNYYGVVATSITLAEQFAQADERNDHSTLGQLLGYPVCCIQMLNTKWKDGFVDPVWQQCENTDVKHIRSWEGNMIRLKHIPWKNNGLLRPFSLGPIFHIKCSHDCKHTLEIAEQWIKLGTQLNQQGMRSMEMFLRMPMEWDVHKGIAYVKTPLFKVAYNSVMSEERYRVQIEGTYFPSEGAVGLGFPWTEQMVTVARNGNQLDLR